VQNAYAVGMRGVFLALEGLDGAGKTTQVELLVGWLERLGRSVVRCRDPGGTTVGEEIRRLLLHSRMMMSVACEVHLYMASRAQLVHEVIRPALANGQTVVCDRFLLSTIVYQGYAGGDEVERIRVIGLTSIDGLLPDWTGVLDLDLEAALRRRRRPSDRIESRSHEFHAKVRNGYLAEARRDPARVRIIDALGEPETVHQRIVAEVRRVLDQADRP
jgi:dTMP kinase